MKIVLKSTVKQAFDTVAEHFDEELFTFLLPPPFVAQLVKYEGSAPGSIVHIRFNFPWRSSWISKITSSRRNDEEFSFVDIGTKLPFGLKTWKHHHIVKKVDETSTAIIDEMEFSTGLGIFDLLAYPVLYLSFYPRKKQYKKYFEEKIMQS